MRKVRVVRASWQRGVDYVRWRARGSPPNAGAVIEQIDDDPDMPSYGRWRHAYGDLRPLSAATNPETSFSVVCHVTDTVRCFFEECVESIRAQTHPGWELILVDDGSATSAVRKVMAEAANGESRIRVIRLDGSTDVVTATNAGIAEARHEYIVFVDPSDRLAQSALEWASTCCPRADVIYTDEDTINVEGWHGDPFFKPAWSPRLSLSFDYVGGLTCIRTSLLGFLGGLTAGTNGVAHHDLLIRISEADVTIAHVPYIAYHHRVGTTLLPEAPASDPEISRYGLAMVERAILRRGWNAHAELGDGPSPRYRIIFDAPAERAEIKVVLPTRDGVHLLRRAVEGILSPSLGVDVHLVIVDNGSEQPETLDYFGHLTDIHDNVTVHRVDADFNFSLLCNAGVSVGPSAPYLLFFNNDVEVLRGEWLRQLVGWLIADPAVVGVGPKLLFPDRTIQHAGVVAGFRGVAGHYALGQPDRPRPGSLCDHAREVSCLTAACLLVRAKDFASVGGFDESLPHDYQDVDFCFRLRTKMHGAFVYDPTYPLTHRESATRGSGEVPSSETVARIRSLWGDELAQEDPFYSPHLSLTLHDFSLRPIPPGDDERRHMIRARWSTATPTTSGHGR